MFTGLIEEIGYLEMRVQRGMAMRLGVKANKVLEHVKLGDSIAVNGVCLTVTDYDRSHFYADVMPQTFQHTNLRLQSLGAPVNLERAMPANGRFGGHFVAGHVDSMGKISSRKRTDNAIVFEIEPEERSMMRYLVPRGSITVDGISLTVVDVTDHSFTIWIIPHTLSETVLYEREPGDVVNLESDMIAKYAEKLLQHKAETSEVDALYGRTGERKTIDAAFLAEHGFLG
jgi:riboflavin synthase